MKPSSTYFKAAKAIWTTVNLAFNTKASQMQLEAIEYGEAKEAILNGQFDVSIE